MPVNASEFANSLIFTSIRRQQKLTVRRARNRENCDVDFFVEGCRIPANRQLLVGTYEYFATMLSGHFDEAESCEIPIHEVDADTFELIIRFCYAGVVRITGENVQNLLQAAHRFQMLDLIDGCSEFLFTQLDPFNCLGVHYFTKFLGLKALAKAAIDFACRNFVLVSASEEFFGLKVEQLVDLLQRNALVVSSEIEVLQAMAAWIEHDEERKSFTEQLLMCVRLTHLSPKIINSTVRPLAKTPEAQKMIDDSMKWIKRIEPRQSLNIQTSLASRCHIIRDTIIAVGNGKNTTAVHVEVYNPSADKWTLVTSIPYRWKFAVTRMSNMLIIAGGVDAEGNGLPEVFSLDLKTLELKQLASMNQPRFNFELTSLNGKLYAVGGVSPRHLVNEVECYDPKKNSWRFIAPIPSGVHNQVKTTTYNGRLYAVFEATARMYCYHPRNNKWRAQAPMSKIWCPKSFTTAGDYLFVVGMGCNPYEDFIERFDPQSNSWSVLNVDYRQRKFGSFFLHEDTLFIIGLERTRYCMKTRKWNTMTAPNLIRYEISLLAAPDSVYGWKAFKELAKE